MSGHTTRQVTELIGLTSDQVRHFVRRGLVDPTRGERGEYLFSFQDVAFLRTAKRVLDGNVSARKALAVFSKLQAGLDDVKSLSSVQVFPDGNNVVVRDEEALWDVETGQGHLDFAVRELANNVAQLSDGVERLLEGKEFEDLDSDDWYNLGLDLEDVEPERAPEAYLRAIALDPENADAHVNLGRLHQLRGHLKQAKQHYQKALDCAPEHQLALYNLGTLFDELEELDTALDYYTRAEGIPDAHYNLARIFEIRGDELAALRHMRRYQQLLEVD